MITLNNHKDSSCHIKLLILFMVLFGLTACDGSNTTMDSRLTVTKQGMGIITSSDNSIDCGGDCTANYNGTRSIKLTATPDTNYTLLDWTGCTHVDGTGCTVEITPNSGDVNVVVRFNHLWVLNYDITFEQPEHLINTYPSFGFGPKHFPENYYMGATPNQFTPLIVDGYGVLTSQVLLMQPQQNSGGTTIADVFTLPLAHNGEFYSLDMDVIIGSVSLTSPFRIFLASATNQSELLFLSDGNVTFNQTQVATYNFNELLHLKIEANILTDRVDISINNQVITDLPLGTNNEDVGSARFYLASDINSEVALDNIRIKTRLDSMLGIPDYDNSDSYIMDFELPVISSPSGQSSTGVHPYSEDYFNVTYVLRRDPSVIGNTVPTNGSVHSAFAASSRPIIYHKYGYPFQIVSAEFAEYSSIFNLVDDIIFTGQKRTGEVLTHTIDKNSLSMNFSQFSFPAEWNNLEYVIINTGGFAVDNIILKLDDHEVGFEVAN